MGYDDPWAESVGTHGPLEQLAPNLWWLWSDCTEAPVRRNMVVWRLADGDLVIHSATCVDEATMADIEALGPVAWLLVPSAGHRIDIKRWKKRYPDARVIAPRNARDKVAEVQAVDDTCENVLPPLGVVVHTPAGVKDGYELIYEVALDDGGRALVVNDLLGGPHPHPLTGFRGWVGRLLGPPGGGFGRARIVRFMFGKDHPAFQGFVRDLAKIDDLRVLTSSHGGPITGDVAGALTEAAPRC